MGIAETDPTSAFQRFPFSFSFFFENVHWRFFAFLVGPVHCSWDPQTSFFNKTFIKNGSNDTIHIFKNYFTTVFSIFKKKSSIQTHIKTTFLP